VRLFSAYPLRSGWHNAAVLSPLVETNSDCARTEIRYIFRTKLEVLSLPQCQTRWILVALNLAFGLNIISAHENVADCLADRRPGVGKTEVAKEMGVAVGAR
jgi:hypothetical protein